MGSRQELIEKYAADMQEHFGESADMDLLGSYAAMRQINVMGTETLIRLTARAGANLIMASSSAVFPLHFGTCWSESFHGSERLREQRVPLIASGADGYSLTKHDAETLAWQAAEDGLPVHVVRLPHLLAPNQASRLFHVAKAWANCGLMPEGPWQWQIAPPMAAAEALLAIAMQPPANARPVTHIALDPIPAPTVQKVIESLGSVTRTTTIPASAAALYREGNLDALIRRYGPAAAMCINEPMLETSSPLEIDPADYLMRCLRPNDGE